MRTLFFVLMLLNAGAMLFNVYAFRLGGALRWANLICIFISGAFAGFTFYKWRKAART